MPVKEHPCGKGLTAACFKAEPQWAKQAFAVRLMSAVVPAPISRRLPKFKLSTLMLFPPGWTPGDPVPPGINIAPGVTFPPGWQPGDPLPPGIIWQPALPPPDAGATPPTFLDPGTPGPITPGARGGAVKKEYSTDIKSYNTDGIIFNRDNSWSICRAADTGTGNSTAIESSGTAMAAVNDFSGYYIERAFFEFPLSGIPAGADIVSASLVIHGIGNADTKVCIQRGTFSGELSNNDFGAYAGWKIDFIDWVRSDIDPFPINEFTFSGTNLAWLEDNFGGAASIVMREYDHDYENLAPGAPITRYLNGCAFREFWDPTNHPLLTIFYKA